MAKGVRLVIKENIPQPLEEILREYRAYTKYVENTYKHITTICSKAIKTKRMNTKEYQRFVRKVARNRNDIIDAFNWSESPEGYAFWEHIYNEFIDKLDQLR